MDRSLLQGRSVYPAHQVGLPPRAARTTGNTGWSDFPVYGRLTALLSFSKAFCLGNLAEQKGEKSSMASWDKIIHVRPERSDALGVHGIAPGETAILDAVDLPIVVISGDFSVARLNAAAKSLLGLSDSDIGRSPVKLFDLVKNLDLLCAQVMSDGAPCRREIRDGDRRFALRIAPYTGCDRQILGAVLTFTNITVFRASLDQAVHEREYTKAILDTVSHPLVALDAKLRVQAANRAFYTMFGVSRGEAQGISIRELGDNVWQSHEVWSSIETSLSDRSEFRAVEIDREFPSIGRRTLALDPRRLELDGDAMVLLAFQDITERKQAERTTSLLAAIVDSSDDAIVSKKLDGTIMTWNKSAERVFGYTAEEAIGKHITLIIPWERRSEEEEILRRLARGERVDHIETVRVRKDGTAVDISLTISPVKDAEGHVLGASKVARDITDRKRTERALAKQARLLDLTTDAIFVRDAADRITYWNRAAMELYGYTCEEALGRVTHELLRTKFPASMESLNEQLHRDDRWAANWSTQRKTASKSSSPAAGCSIGPQTGAPGPFLKRTLTSLIARKRKGFSRKANFPRVSFRFRTKREGGSPANCTTESDNFSWR